MNEPVKIGTDINARMVQVMRDLGAIGKDKKNESQGFKYRGIDDVYNALNPILSKHGVFMLAEVVGKTREERTNAKGTVLAFTCLRMRYHFVSEDGSSIFTEAEGEGMDSGDKSSNKAMAIAHKYALLQAFCIPTQDLVDPDAEVHEVGPALARHKSEPDADIKAGVDNWLAKQKDILLNYADLDQMTAWLKKNASLGGREGTWDRPTPGSALDKLLKFSVPLFNDLKSYYMEKMREV